MNNRSESSVPIYRDHSGSENEGNFPLRPCASPECPHLVRASKPTLCIPCRDKREARKSSYPASKSKSPCGKCGKTCSGALCQECYLKQTRGSRHKKPDARCTRETASKICDLLLMDPGVGSVYSAMQGRLGA